MDADSNSVYGKNEEINEIDEGDVLAQPEQPPANEGIQSRGKPAQELGSIQPEL